MAKKKLIDNYDAAVFIEGSSSKDILNNYADDVSIDAGAGNDTVKSEGSRVSISGGKGKDVIDTGSGDSMTVVGGKGNDTIIGSTLRAEVYQYAKGDGKDVIYGFDRKDIFHVVDGAIKKFTKKGDDLILKIGSGKVTLKGAAENLIRVRDTDGVITTLDNDPSDKVLFGESLNNRQSNMLVMGTDSDDDLSNTASNVTIFGGSGNDAIKNSGSGAIVDVVLDGGDGDDLIVTENTGKGGTRTLTMSGGTGDDTLICSTWDDYLNGEMILYGEGDGHDIVLNFSDEDTLFITDGSPDAYYIDGDDILISLQNSDSVTLKNFTSLSAKIYTSNGLLDTIKILGNERDYIINSAKPNSNINVSDGNDSITVSGGNSSTAATAMIISAAARPYAAEPVTTQLLTRV